MNNDLPENARRALVRARAEKLSYVVRLLKSPDGRILAILGEAHMKFEKASAIGKEVVGAFELRGVETFQRDKVTWGRALGIVINAPRVVLRALSFGALKGSTITDAKQLPSGWTVELERAKHMPLGLHVASIYMTSFFIVSALAVIAPLIATFAPWLAAIIAFVAVLFQVHMLALVPAWIVRRFSWSWLIHPFLGILTPRDILMSSGTVQMLADHPRVKSAVVVMGRAHVSGYEALLVDKHGFTRVEA